MSGPRERDYQPCGHECNGCPTCDPGLRPTADTGPSERDEIAAERQALIDALYADKDLGPGYMLRDDCEHLADRFLASDWLAERDRRTAAKTRPEVLRERVEYETRSEWRGCRCGHPGAGCYCTSVTVRTGRKRTITEFKPVVSEWTDQ